MARIGTVDIMMNNADAGVCETPDAAAISAIGPAYSKPGARAFLGTFFTSTLIQATAVLQGIIVARLLGPSGRGEYATVVLWPTVFASIGIFGTNIVLARAAARVQQRDALTRTALFLALITSVISVASCLICLPRLLPEKETHLLWLCQVFATFIVLNHLTQNLLAVDQGAGNFKRFNLTRAILNPVYLVFLVIMFLAGIRQVQYVVLGLLAANLAVVVVRFTFLLGEVRLWGPLYSPNQLIRQSVRFGLVGVAMPLYLQADKAIMLWQLGSTNLGLYVVALSAGAAVADITNSASMVSFTLAAQARQGQGFEVLAKTFRIASLLWLVCGGLLAFAMPLLLPAFYGSEFAPAINPARLLILGSALAGLANLLDQTMRGQGRPFVGLEGRVAGLVVLVSLGCILSRYWGLMGMCVAFVFCQFTCLSVFVRRVLNHYGQHAWAICDLVPRWSDVVGLWLRFRASRGRIT